MTSRVRGLDADLDLTIDRGSKEVTATSADSKIVTQDVAQDAGTKAILDKYTRLSAPLANRVIGSITADIRSARDNASGQKAGLIHDQISGGEQPGEVTYAEVFTVQPFGNTLVVKTCTGQQIYDVLKQQLDNPAPGSNRIMLPSANVHYRWTTTGGPHIVDGSVSFDGGATPIDKAASYRVAVNNFMADGGDNYTIFRACTQPLRERTVNGRPSRWSFRAPRRSDRLHNGRRESS